MNKPIRVFLDALPWDYRPRNTDWRYVRYSLPQLTQYVPELVMNLQTSNRITLSGNLKAVRTSLSWRLGRPLGVYQRETSYLSAKDLARSNSSVIFSQRGYPLNAGDVPVAWENAIVDPEMQLSYWAKDSDLDEEITAKEKLFRKASAVQVFSQAEASRHSEMFPHLAGRFIGIPWFAPHIHACSRATLEKHCNPPLVRILFVGNNAVRKGIQQLFDAFVQLPVALQRRAELTVVSNFDCSPVKIPSNDRIVIVRGASSQQVMSLMQRAHIFVNVAQFESYGVVFHEAMSQGTACLAPRWEVQRELFADGRAGINLPCEPTAIRNALERFIEDDDYRYAMALAAWERFQQNYAPEIVARQYADLFRVVANHGDPKTLTVRQNEISCAQKSA